MLGSRDPGNKEAPGTPRESLTSSGLCVGTQTPEFWSQLCHLPTVDLGQGITYIHLKPQFSLLQTVEIKYVSN